MNYFFKSQKTKIKTQINPNLKFSLFNPAFLVLVIKKIWILIFICHLLIVI